MPARIADVLLWGVLVGLFFRMFSKNLPRRRAENQKWVNWWWRVRSSSSGARARHADKEHKYFTCKQCKTICRVPVGKGKLSLPAQSAAPRFTRKADGCGGDIACAARSDQLLNFSCELGRQLLQNGAEIYRVEDSIQRLLTAYGYARAEIFAIPFVSF